MKQPEAALRRYYREIRSFLPCLRRDKKRILSEIRNSIAQYREEHPDADFGQIEAHFGKPQAIAAACVDGMNTCALLNTLRVRRRILLSFVIGIIIALAMWAIAVTTALLEHFTSINGFTEQNLIIIDEDADKHR